MRRFARWIPQNLRQLDSISCVPLRSTKTSVGAKDVDGASFQQEAVLYVHVSISQRKLLQFIKTTYFHEMNKVIVCLIFK